MSTLNVLVHLPGRTVPATLSRDHAASSFGVPVLVLPPGGSYPRETAFGPADVTDHGLAACLVLSALESDEGSPMECSVCGKAPAGLRAGDDCPDDECDGRVYFRAGDGLLDAWNASCAALRDREPVTTMAETWLDAGGWTDGSEWHQEGRSLTDELDAMPFDSEEVRFVVEPVELVTRVPESRKVEGLEYGAIVTRPGRSFYHIRFEGGAWGVAGLTPADDELVGSDVAILEAIAGELEAAASDARAWTFPDGSGVVAYGDVWDVFDRQGRAATGRVVR